MATTKQVKPTGKKPPNAGKGRTKGSLNKTTTALKDAILLAATQVGMDGSGKDGLTGYLKQVARTDRKAFSSLLGRVLPLQVVGPGGGPVVARIELVPLRANGKG